MIVSPNAIIHLVRFFVRCTLHTCSPSLARTGFFLQCAKASAHDPVRKLWATEGELASSRESLLAIGGMRAGTRLKQGVEPSAQPPRIQVALATGKLVLPEQGCLGQGGCEAKPD